MSQRPVPVSILVPAYNAARYLPELCRSIQAQTYPHYEVLIANDGSTDNTVSVLAPFLRDQRFQLLGWEENRGLNQTWAVLCSRAKGDYWCCPGADDVLYPTFVENRVNILQANPHAGLVHGPAELIDESGGPCRSLPQLPALPAQLQPPRSISVLLQHNVIRQPSALVRMDLTRQVLPFFSGNWVYAPDWFFWILHAATGCDLLWDAPIQLKYRIHSESLTLLPAKAAARHAEVALVPLCALAAAAPLSPFARELWALWRKTLYHRWLLRALTLRARGELKREWLEQGAAAFYDNKKPRVSLWFEAAKHGAGACASRSRERTASRSQRFPVAGIAQVNDPVFRLAPTSPQAPRVI
jgi:glycosyltransferase involved in cell wall biosynthesis